MSMSTNKPARVRFQRSVIMLSLCVTLAVISISDIVVAQETMVDDETLRNDLIEVLEMRYQLALDSPATPTTQAGLMVLDMAIDEIQTASHEELQIIRSAPLDLEATKENLLKLRALTISTVSVPASVAGHAALEATAGCDDGYIESENEFVKPPGPCNQQDSHVVDVNYLPADSNDLLPLTDTQYPITPVCKQYISAEATAIWILDANLAALNKVIWDRSCGQAVLFGVSGGNSELLCIPTDLIALGVELISDGIQHCNAIRGAAEGRTSYVRTGELFVQNAGNTEYVDTRLVDGFDDMNGEVNAIKQQACENANRLNQSIAQLNEVLRTVRVRSSRLLDLFGSQLDPIEPIPLSLKECTPQAIANSPPEEARPVTTTPSPTIATPAGSPVTRPIRRSTRRGLRPIEYER